MRAAQFQNLDHDYLPQLLGTPFSFTKKKYVFQFIASLRRQYKLYDHLATDEGHTAVFLSMVKKLKQLT